MKTHLPDRERFFCDQCPYFTVKGERMNRHVRREHGDEVKNKVEFICYCGKTLTSKSGLNNHIKYTHQKQKNHGCTFCEKAFTTPSRLKVCNCTLI